jgi:hypothetical protein
MDTLRQTQLVDASLQSPFQEVFNPECQDIIELHARFVEDTDTDKTANEGIAFEKALWIFLIEGQEFTDKN